MFINIRVLRLRSTDWKSSLRAQNESKSTKAVVLNQTGNDNVVWSLETKSSVHSFPWPQFRGLSRWWRDMVEEIPWHPSSQTPGWPKSVPQAFHRTAQQKRDHLELMLGQIVNCCPVISRNTIVKNSTSLSSIWQAIRLHFGFQSTGAHFRDFNNITLAPAERPEDLYQRLMSFIDDNLLLANGSISNHGEVSGADEMSPTLEKSCSTNMVEISPWPSQFG